MKKKNVVLLRVSKDLQEFASQKNAIDKYIKENKIVVHETITEHGVSAFQNKIDERESLVKIRDMARNGEIETLIVFDLDRIIRNMLDGMIFIEELTKYDVKVFSVRDHKIVNEGSNDADRLMNVIKFYSSEQESKKISERSKNGIEAINKRGLYAGGIVNFGYKVENQKLVILEEESKIVKLAFEYYIKYGSIKTIRKLNEAGLLRRGNKWSRENLYFMLTNTVYIGYKRYGGSERKIKNDFTCKKWIWNKDKVKYQPYNESIRIIDDETFNKVQKLLKERKCKKGECVKGVLNRSSELLEGLVYHVCGDGQIRKLIIDYNYKRNKGEIKKYAAYRCKHCRENKYKDVKKSYGSMKLDKEIDKNISEILEKTSIEEIEQKFKDSIKYKNNEYEDMLFILDKDLEKKTNALKNANQQLIDILSGDSKISIETIDNIIQDLKKEIQKITDRKKEIQKEIKSKESENLEMKERIEIFKDIKSTYSYLEKEEKKRILPLIIKRIIIKDDDIEIERYI